MGLIRSQLQKARMTGLLGSAICWSLLLLLGVTTAGTVLVARDFQAGASRTIITPWLGLSVNGGMQDQTATRIHDDLYARALVLDNGQFKLALVVADSCVLPREVVEAARHRISARTGLKGSNILISATHTHSAPTAAAVFQSDPDPEYRSFLVRKLGDAVEMALQNLAPARIGWGQGTVSGQVFNRRWKMKSGMIPPNPFGSTDGVKTNPRPGTTELVKPAGPTDPSLWVLSVQTLAGIPVALFANYSLHYVGGTKGGDVSADYYGIFASILEKSLGTKGTEPPFVAMMSNGTSGDINNINFFKKSRSQLPYRQMRRVARAVADEALSVYQQIVHYEWIPLGVREGEIKLSVRLPTPAEVERARQIVGQVQGPAMETLEQIYARETILLSRYPASVSVLLQIFRIGDLIVNGIPCEVFVEVGLEIRQRSFFPLTFTVGLANGYYGYLPTRNHHRMGGYETWRARSSYLELDAADLIVKRLLNMIDDLK